MKARSHIKARSKRIYGRIWVEGATGPYLGDGRIALLEGIKEKGSISAAAKTMGMSYKKAWTLVDSMNDQARSPLVMRTSGGKHGGGTLLTAEGERILEDFKQLRARCFSMIEEVFEQYDL